MMTAIDPLEPGQVLGKLASLKDSLESIAAREESMAGALTTCLVAARREARRLEEMAQGPEEAKRHELVERHQEERAAAESKHAARLSRIENAYHSARGSLTDRIARERDGTVGRMQGEMLRRQEERERDIEAAKEAVGSMHEVVAAEGARISTIERDGLRALLGFHALVAGKLAGHGVEAEHVGGDRERLIEEAVGRLDEVRRLPMVKVFRYLPVGLWLAAAVGLAAWLSGEPTNFKVWWKSAALAVAAVVVLYGVAFASVAGAVRRLAVALQKARVAGADALGVTANRVAELKNEIRLEAEELRGGLSTTLRTSEEDSQQRIREGRERLESRIARLPGREERLHERRLARVEAGHAERMAASEGAVAKSAAEREAERRNEVEAAEREHEVALATLAQRWPEEVTRVIGELKDLNDLAADRFPAWSDGYLKSWSVPHEALSVVPFGRLEIGLDRLAGKLPQDPRFDRGGADGLQVPLALGFPHHGSLLLEGSAQDAAAAINGIVLRLLAGFPPGRVAFTFIDPVGLGRDFAGLMHLADYEDSIIHGRIWTQAPQIEERLAELNEHVEKVIQMYLRNEYATIAEYNEQAGTIAEKYRFVVIAGFPTGFSEVAMARLRSLAASGARCGVYLLMQMGDGAVLADKALEAELRKNAHCLKQAGDEWILEKVPGGRVVLDPAPDDELATRLVHRFGQASVDSNRVEVPFSSIAPEGELWTERTGDELRVPIGRAGAKKLQYLAIGKGTRQHALIAGKTGSGKSTLFHVMITNLALYCSPDEVEFYLVDFKKGVEFKCYGSKRLPHARVVAIESDREFGLSVLHRVDEELRRRGEWFRECGAQDVAGYRKATGKSLPRTLLLIDEFQEFFTEDDGTGQEASLLLDRIVRQGRAFGIHAILGSQTLGGAYTLARATLGQMVIRIALQCNEADAYLIMDDDNPAPRLLTRPGEGIYNDNAGAVASNSPFQTVWLSEEERNAELDRVTALARERGTKWPAPVVFEGNAPADLRDNELLAEALEHPATERPKSARAWLGAPNSIKGPTEAVFRRQSGSNLLIVGQGEERMKAMLGGAMISLAAQYPPDGARFVVLDPEGGEGDLGRLLERLPQGGEVHLPGDLEAAMSGLAERLAAGDGPEIFVVVRDLQRFKGLKSDESFSFSMDDDGGGASPAKVFEELVSEGAAVGIHVIASVDTWNNVGRWIARKALGEFQMRVLFQMSANDSAALIDSPAAGNLGLHRALLYNEAMGSLETFRPYGRADAGVLETGSRGPA